MEEATERLVRRLKFTEGAETQWLYRMGLDLALELFSDDASPTECLQTLDPLHKPLISERRKTHDISYSSWLRGASKTALGTIVKLNGWANMITLSREEYEQLLHRPAANSATSSSLDAFIASHGESWMIDSSVTSGLTGNRSHFLTLSTSPKFLPIRLADGSYSPLSGSGTIQPTYNLTLTDVLFAPKFPVNLISNKGDKEKMDDQDENATEEGRPRQKEHEHQHVELYRESIYHHAHDRYQSSSVFADPESHISLWIKPRSVNWEAALRILKCIKASPGKGLLFKRHGHVKIEAYSDSDYAGSKDDMMPTSGYYTYVGGNLMTWRSKKQTTVARSSAEVEYRAMAHTTSEILWLKNPLKELGFMYDDPVPMHCDNQAVIHIASNPIFYERTKHIEVDCHFVREAIISQKICTPFTTSSEKRVLLKP
ncbi:Retrovirus-related Pol polyprotein from transposon RE2 [Sesamum angolense]|uniref:Retrovirus-related Pol polyprotein from transposon RE2 n=1 Tax=Sesamum angolense TaxID=2727404 RepID=A0AAE2C577_9LAMI|nr:Retrovirus-related Pol polyprotein from transposon RE2 [Sesamum angolense]